MIFQDIPKIYKKVSEYLCDIEKGAVIYDFEQARRNVRNVYPTARAFRYVVENNRVDEGYDGLRKGQKGGRSSKYSKILQDARRTIREASREGDGTKNSLEVIEKDNNSAIIATGADLRHSNRINK